MAILVVIVTIFAVGIVFAKPQGKPQPNRCSDTDGGIALSVQGTTSGYYNRLPYSHTDYCVDAGNVREYYCSGTFEQNQTSSCGNDSYGANYCMNSSVYRNFTNYGCATGACGSTVTPQLVQTCQYGCTSGACNLPTDSCSDSDGGFVVTVQGAVTGYSGGLPYNITDNCLNNTTLVENYCSGSGHVNSNYNCGVNATTICTSGRCV